MRFTSDDNADAKLNAFRGYYLADVAESASAAARAQAASGNQYHTLFSNAGVSSVGDGSVHDALSIIFEGDIPIPTATPTGINPIIQTIEADGSTRYFDLQGRLLQGKPEKGMYVLDGKKIITK